MNKKTDSNPTSSKTAVRKTILRNVEFLTNPKPTVMKQSRRTVSDLRSLCLEENIVPDNSDVFKKPQLHTTLKIAKKITEAKNMDPRIRYKSTGDLTPKTKKVFRDEVISIELLLKEFFKYFFFYKISDDKKIKFSS